MTTIEDNLIWAKDHQINSHSPARNLEKQLPSCSSEQSLFHSMLGGGGGKEGCGGRVTREWNITLLNLGHHTRALRKQADPRSRDLETDWIKVGGRNSVARQNYLWTKKLRSPAEDDNLHLNFEPVLSRLMGRQREGDENSCLGLAFNSLYYMFPFFEKDWGEELKIHSSSIYFSGCQSKGCCGRFRTEKRFFLSLYKVGLAVKATQLFGLQTRRSY